MKTIREHLSTLPEPYRTQALNNMDAADGVERDNLAAALSDAFYWDESPDGNDYWKETLNRIERGEIIPNESPDLASMLERFEAGIVRFHTIADRMEAREADAEYRLLTVSDVRTDGDEFKADEGRWIPLFVKGVMWNDLVGYYRRKITKPESFQLEIGKCYLTRDGRETRPLEKTGSDIYPFGGAITGYGWRTWDGNGSFTGGCDKHAADLVSEIVQPDLSNTITTAFLDGLAAVLDSSRQTIRRVRLEAESGSISTEQAASVVKEVAETINSFCKS